MADEKTRLSSLSDEELAHLYVELDDIASWLCGGAIFEDLHGAVDIEICRRFCKLTDEQHFWCE